MAAWVGYFGALWKYSTVGAVTNRRAGEIADAPGLSPWGEVSG